MLEPLMDNLGSKCIVLASGSPRRSEILRQIGLRFIVLPSKFEENLDKSRFGHPKDYVLENAKLKALEVVERMAQEKHKEKPDIVIGADTVVVHENKILEKPKSKDDAFAMLRRLSGCEHKVYSGVALVQPSTQTKDNSILPDPKITQFYEETLVTFGDLSEDVIKGYIETGEPMDKAGSYGIQGKGGSLVTGIHGDYFNVMGFPLYHFCKQIKKLYE
ncbi:probable bifunctional dTTP/UTP pyrophosphatase/methyltransferase protein [Actinia tenebrosa]|uniref:Probable bifunctional dTTP/UTP pyrophosphatase/methyltransferase protein n=1 Tax=Actinia tenebrosa TaxID=6105 RepID=A0A6P8HZ99_ACTTE|nr:probable bifunctional dTTP/UTP pyrophosphatase/methyltransferase protein [Actinia tenebrosa]